MTLPKLPANLPYAVVEPMGNKRRRGTNSPGDFVCRRPMKRLWGALNRNGGRELMLDTLTYGFAKGGPGVFGLLSVVVFLRLTGETAYGRFALIIAIVNVWITFSSGWFYQGILRFGDSLTEPRQFERVKRTGLVLCGLAFLLGCLPHLGWEIGASTATAAALVYGGIALVQTTQLAELQAHLQAQRVLVVELLRSAAGFFFAAGLAWWWVSEGPTALLLGTALGYGLSVVYGRRGQSASGATDVIEATASGDTGIVLRRIWNFGWPLSLWLAGQLMLPLIDRTMMAMQLGLAETGKYAGMSDILTRCFSLAVFPLVQAAYPRLAQLTDRNDHDRARSLLQRATLLLLLAGAAILPALYWMRHLVVWVALPVLDEQMAQLVLPLATGGFVWQAAMLVHKPLELAKKTRHMLVAMIAAIGIKLAGNWLLLPNFASLGAAVATLVSGIVYCLLCLLFCRRPPP